MKVEMQSMFCGKQCHDWNSLSIKTDLRIKRLSLKTQRILILNRKEK